MPKTQSKIMTGAAEDSGDGPQLSDEQMKMRLYKFFFFNYVL